jgi:octaprenyl-diphosphate synthase
MDLNGKYLERFRHHLERINEESDRVLNSRVSLIKNIEYYDLGNGKRLRPLFFVLSCQLCDYQGEDLYRLSTVFEYANIGLTLHNHVLENSKDRKNNPSPNHKENQAVILEGDFLASKSSSIALSANNLLFAERFLENGVKMAEGKFLEMIHTDDLSTSKEQYLEIVKFKTAALISTACVCGAIISGAEMDAEKALEGFGLNIGIALQLLDDLMDYTCSEVGFHKPAGKDLREGKITLPLIYTLLKLEQSERKRLEDLFRNHQATEKDYKNLVELVENNGAIDKIRNEARSYVDKAASCLSPFPDTPDKMGLLELSQYIIKIRY